MLQKVLKVSIEPFFFLALLCKGCLFVYLEAWGERGEGVLALLYPMLVLSK